MANELKPWKYDIQYGPDGEENYAWVYDNHGAMVATMKTHKAKEIVDRMNTRPATPVEGLDSYEYGFPSMTKVERGGDWCDRSQAEAIIAVERAQSVRWAASCGELFSEVETLKADNAALTARVKEWREESERKSEDWFDFCKAIGIEIDTHEAVADAINTARSNDGNEFKALETKLAATKKALERADEALQLGATEPGHTYVKIALGEVQS